MKTAKRILCIILSLVVLSCAIPFAGFAASAIDLPAGAEWLIDSGDDHVWYSISSKTLTVGGVGKMPDYINNASGYTPWFDSKSDITSVIIEPGVTTIGNYAFNGCSAVTSITIPSGVTGIGSYAFSDCTALTGITIPSSVMKIGSYAFNNCNMLSSLYIDSIESWCGVIRPHQTSHPFNGTASGKKLYVGGVETNRLVIPSTVKEIPSYAFCNCDGVTSVTIMSGVTGIGNYSFSGCSAVTSVTIPSSVTIIGSYAFNKCDALTSVTVKAATPPALTSYYAFPFNTASFTKIYVPYEKINEYKEATQWSNKNLADKIAGAYIADDKLPANGSISLSKDCFPVSDYTSANETVTVTAVPDKGYRLKSLVWNDGTEHDITAAKSFKMPLDSVTVTAEFEEAPALIPIDIPSAETTNFVYDGTEKVCLTDGTGYTVTNGAETNAGSYTLTAALADGYIWSDGTTASKSIDWKISKATPDVSLFNFDPPENLVADGTGKAAGVTFNDNGGTLDGIGNITVYYQKDGGAKTDKAPTAAGTYTVSIKVSEGNNYSSAEEITNNNWTFTVITVTDYHIANSKVDKGGLMGRQTKIGDESKGRVIIPVTEKQLEEIGDKLVIVGGDFEKETTVEIDCAYTYFYDGETKIEAKDITVNENGDKAYAFIIIDCDAEHNPISGYGYYRLYNNSASTENFLFDVIYADPKGYDN